MVTGMVVTIKAVIERYVIMTDSSLDSAGTVVGSGIGAALPPKKNIEEERERDGEERKPRLIKKERSEGRPKVETRGMFGMNKLPLSFMR